MSFALLFSVLMVLWLFFGIWGNWPGPGGTFKPISGSVILFALLFLLGWKVFGPIIHP